MISGERAKNRRMNFDAAIMASAEPLRIDDPDIDPSELEAALYQHSSEQDNSGYDVESFIYQLKYRELVVLLFRSFNAPTKDIAGILNMHPSRIYIILEDLEKKLKDRV